MNQVIRLFFTITFAFSLVSCGYSSLELPNTNDDFKNNLGDEKLTKNAIISWPLIRESVMSTCMKCHINHSRPELGALPLVQGSMKKIMAVINNNEMPPAKNGYNPLDNCKKQVLEAWAANGAPESLNIKIGTLSECQSLPVGGELPVEELPLSKMPLNYNTLLTKILQNKCINCHNPDTEDLEAAGILFYPFQEILDRADLWDGPGKESKIVSTLISEDEDKRMPRPIPPEKFQALSSEEVDFIIRWIDAGKPNSTN